MAKLKYSLNITEILNRMMVASKLDNLAQLAEKLGVSHQSLAQTRKRGMISLSILMLCVEKTGCTLDYLVYGRGDNEFAPNRIVQPEEDLSYIAVPQFKGPPIKILENLLPRGIDTSSLQATVFQDMLWIIDKSVNKMSTGHFAVGELELPGFLECKKKWNGTYVITEGLGAPEDPITEEALSDIVCVGRVVWFGSRGF